MDSFALLLFKPKLRMLYDYMVVDCRKCEQ